MKKTLSKLTLGLMIGLVLLWIIVFACALTDVNGVLDMWAYLVLISITLSALAVRLMMLNFVRRLLSGTIRYADRTLFVFSNITTAVHAFITVSFMKPLTGTAHRNLTVYRFMKKTNSFVSTGFRRIAMTTTINGI